MYSLNVGAALAILANVLGAATAGKSLRSGGSPISPSVAGNWSLTFFDEFEGTSLKSYWAARQNESHCSPCEPQLYMADRVSVGNGMLTITTSPADLIGPNGQDYKWSSGWISTEGKRFQKYGLFEVRAKLPSSNATGIWPAHWLMPESNQCWPTGGEIDIMEYTAAPVVGNTIFGSYRWGTKCGDNKQVLPGAPYPPLFAPGIDFAADWHVFACTWNATAISFFVDGRLYETKTAAEVVLPTAPMYMILNTAIAWYFPPSTLAGYPAHHYVDYVRWWQYSDLAHMTGADL